MLSSLLLPLLRARFPDRGLIEGSPPDPCATFPGLHPGIRRVCIFDDGHELTVCIDDLTHSHFWEHNDALPKAERKQRIVESVVAFLDDLFADRVAVWGVMNVGGGWYYHEFDKEGGRDGVQAFIWSGPLSK